MGAALLVHGPRSTIGLHPLSRTVFSFIIFFKLIKPNEVYQALDDRLIDVRTMGELSLERPKSGCGRLIDVAPLFSILFYIYFGTKITGCLMEILLYMFYSWWNNIKGPQYQQITKQGKVQQITYFDRCQFTLI